MGKAIKEALQTATGAATEWLGEVSNETIVTMVKAFAIMAATSEESEIPVILMSAIAALRKFRTREANAVIGRIETELRMGWAEKKGPQRLAPLL